MGGRRKAIARYAYGKAMTIQPLIHSGKGGVLAIAPMVLHVPIHKNIIGTFNIIRNCNDRFFGKTRG